MKILQTLYHSNTSAAFKCVLLGAVACEKIFKIGLERYKYSMVHIKFENVIFLSQDLLSVSEIYTFCCTSFKTLDCLIMQMNFWPPERQAEQTRLHSRPGFLSLAALLRTNDICQVDPPGEPISPFTVGETGSNLDHY